MSTMPIAEVDFERDDPNEFTVVEQPLLTQLVGLGWDYVAGDLEYPAKTFRTSFRETVLEPRLKAAIKRINKDDHGNEWLDDLTIERAVRELLKPDGRGLLELNRNFTHRLQTGVRVTVADGPRSGEEITVHAVAWDKDRLADNDFLAINQFQVLIKGTPYNKRPDVVLFVNGLPLVVIECKSPAITSPMEQAVDQLLHYSNQRELDHAEREGIPELFHFNALVIGSHFYQACASTLGDTGEYFAEWKDTSPIPEADVLRELGKTSGPLSSQERLVAGMLRPAHLLDLMRNFTVWDTDEGRLVKKVARYQQFRAVHATVDQLESGKTRAETGDQDTRGGVVWHTQGSGKSLTMAFLVKKIRTLPELRAFKVVVVSDRTSLERQLRGTMQLAGENIRPSEQEKKQNLSQVEIAQRILREEGPDLVFCMIQKNQDIDLETETLTAQVAAYVRKDPPQLESGDGGRPALPPDEPRGPKTRFHNSDADPARRELAAGTEQVTRTLRATIPKGDGKVEKLNESERVILLIDECHRSQAGEFHSYMMAALPNAVRIGFTGTPIFREGDKNTLGIFGRFLDVYGMTASWQDGATVEIVYEGRSADGLVDRTTELDQAFNNRFHHYTEAERAIIRQRYGNEPDILEAWELIGEKARDMMLHYAGDILPNGFKAQVVAVSRKAAVRYHEKLVKAKTDLLAALAALPPEKLTLSPDDLAKEPEWTQYLIRVHQNRQRLQELEIAVVISGEHKDPISWKQWTDEAAREKHEADFKKPFSHEKPEKRSPLGILVVKNMLLTGFDAPVEQVLYLDRKMEDHELLQAITRVNRKKTGKPCGYVVDYAGVADALVAAKKAVEKLEKESGGPSGGGTTMLKEALPRLREAHQRVMQLFTSRGATSLLPIDPAVQLLADAKLRAEFITKLRTFLACLGTIFTRPEAAEFKRDAKILAFIARVASNVYQDPQLLLIGVEAKVKQLVDTYIAAQGIDPVIPPTSLMDAKFADEIKKYGSSRTRASAMQHAIRLQLAVKLREDPTFYKTISEKFEAILQELKDRWEEQIAAFDSIIAAMAQGNAGSSVEGIDARTHGPFFGILQAEYERAGGASLETNPQTLTRMVELTQTMVAHIQQEIRTVDFWQDKNSQRHLENWLSQTIRRSRLFDSKKAEALATEVMQTAEARKRMLVS
jgi:type I restriction enzyme R subunit